MVISATSIQAQQLNTLTAQEKSDGWVLLFDGKTMDGWRKNNSTEMAQNWVIDDQAMKVCMGTRAGRGQGGDILFGTKKFSNFELSIDWKIAREGNSGIFFNIVERQGEQIYWSAPEVQVLDNWNADDNKGPNRLAGSLYDMIPALPSNAKPSGVWNTIVIRVKDGNVTHTQNGEVVVQYTMWTPEWYEMIAKSKFKDWEGFKEGVGPAKAGYIGLQDHGYDCWFRNIKIREL